MFELTIAIPTYNSEKFLDKCIASFIYPDGTIDSRLQLIIVNDGSKDNTLAVASRWAEKYPLNISVIDKENAGHGSGINAGADATKGRYYKVVDSDDWVVTDNLCMILDALEETDADVAVTGYHTVNMASGVTLPYGTGRFTPEYEGSLELTLEEFMQVYEDVPAAQSFHGLMYNTGFYRGTGIRMSEKVFFEDQEYAILPFAHVGTMRIIPYFFYEYRIGSAGQSVNFANQAVREGDFLKVVRKMIAYHVSRMPLEKPQNDFIVWRLSNAVVSYYATVLVKAKERSEEKAALLRSFLIDCEPEIAKRTEGKYKLLRRLGRLPGLAGIYGWLFNSRFFAAFKKTWVK
ncbi:MAG: glycosyltransferase family 2 protein [Lachnospiraceae bacterium]|jgi:glycosyltransferase involved in cell wall biosynthesis